MILRQRIVYDCLLVLSLMAMPWWFTFCLGLLFTFRVPYFYEFIVVGIVLDVLYSVPVYWLFGVTFGMTLTTIVSYCLVRYIVRYIR